MKDPADKSGFLTTWGVSLLNKLSSVTRNRRKRDASKRRRLRDRREIRDRLGED